MKGMEMTTTDEKTMVIGMTAGYWARAVAELLSRKSTTTGERERLIDEIRQIAQFAADHDGVALVKTRDLPEGKN